MNNKEVWKPVPGYESRYMVSNHARVMSLRYKKRKDEVGYLKPILRKNGYVVVNLMKNGKMKQFRLHRLVAEAFLGPTDLTIDHIDGNKQNNHLDNLQILSSQDNSRKSFEGSKASWATINEEIVRKIKTDIAAGIKLKDISERYSVNYHIIVDIKRGRNWKHVKI